MLINVVFLVALVQNILAIDASNSTATHGCVEASSNEIDGNYIKHADWNNHSIWMKNTTFGTYVIYFEKNLGNQYEAFGVYACDAMSTYTEAVDQMIEKSPSLVMGCQGTPHIFCPALDDDDAGSLMDGMSATDGRLDWIHIYDFFDCNHWFVYSENQNYPTPASLSFDEDEYCVVSDEEYLNNNKVIPPGQKTEGSVPTDEAAKPKMSDDDKTVLIVCVAVFSVICFAAIGYFGYKWWLEKKIEEAKESHVALTEETEEDKFSVNAAKREVATPLVEVTV